MAFVFLAGPESFVTLSHGQIQYSNLGAAAWGNTGDTITYEYDDNGSLTSKVTDELRDQFDCLELQMKGQQNAGNNSSRQKQNRDFGSQKSKYGEQVCVV